MLEAQEGNLELARQMLKCSVKADPTSQQSWQVSSSGHVAQPNIMGQNCEVASPGPLTQWIECSFPKGNVAGSTPARIVTAESYFCQFNFAHDFPDASNGI